MLDQYVSLYRHQRLTWLMEQAKLDMTDNSWHTLPNDRHYPPRPTEEMAFANIRQEMLHEFNS